MSLPYRKLIHSRTPSDRTDPHEVGGKAYNLFKLRGFGFPVPDWLVLSSTVFDEIMSDRITVIESILSGIDHSSSGSYDAASSQIGDLILSADLAPELETELLDHVSVFLDEGPFYSVRSSVSGEDSAQNSFAGQMDSFLCVRRDELLDAVKRVWASAYSSRSLAYRHTKNVSLSGISAAVIIQNMIEAKASGVLFTRHPETWSRQCHVTAAYGLGEGVVSDRVICDTYRLGWDSAGIGKDVPLKDFTIMPDRERLAGTSTEVLSFHQKKQQVLADDLIRELCFMAIRIERAFTVPQDIEWACDGHGKLHILQSRPITAPPPVKKNPKIRIWDNSNIVESYPGLTLPLTFSFIRKGYEVSFKSAILGLMVGRKVPKGASSLFDNMLGLIEGRVYYNLLNWYQMLSYLPGFPSHRKSWDQMIGIQEKTDYPGTRLSTLHRAYSCLKIAHLLLNLKGCGRRFGSDFSSAYRWLKNRDLSGACEDDLADTFEEARRKFGGMWHLTLYNDFAAMKYYDWLKKLVERWGPPDRPNIHNDLLCGVHGLESIEPLRALVRIAEKVESTEVFRRLFESEDDADVWREIHGKPHYEELRALLKTYLDKYGDRTLEDLKLEKPGYHERPEQLLELVRNYCRSGVSADEMEIRESGVRHEPERSIKDHLKSPLKRWVYSLVLKNARIAIANRENMRFARSRLYGLMRQLFLRMGELFEGKGFLESRDDIFYLTVEEVFGLSSTTGVTRDLRSTVRNRKSEYRSYGTRKPKGRIVTTGIPRLEDIYGPDETPEKGVVLSGIGCSSGTAEGIARVDFDPGAAVPDGNYILVARSTDPGWVFLMISSAGIVAEKGSVLSHTAIIGRELGIPTVVGVRNATSIIRDGTIIRMDGAKGEIRCL